MTSFTKKTYFCDLTESHSEGFPGLNARSMNGLVVGLGVLLDLLDLHQPRAPALIFPDGP